MIYEYFSFLIHSSPAASYHFSTTQRYHLFYYIKVNILLLSLFTLFFDAKQLISPKHNTIHKRKKSLRKNNNLRKNYDLLYYNYLLI